MALATGAARSVGPDFVEGWGTPGNIARTVAFLVYERLGFANRQVHGAGGGMAVGSAPM